MKIENRFHLGMPPDEAYALLLDLDRVVPCLPGAELQEAGPDGERKVSVGVKLGPMRFLYDGTVRITETDPAARRAVMVGEGREKRGGGTAAATIVMTVAEAGAGSDVSSKADIKLTGRAAQNGRGIVEDVSSKLIGQMAATLEERYAASAPAHDSEDDSYATGGGSGQAEATDQPAGQPPAAPIKGGRLLMSVLWGRVKAFFARLFGRPAAD
jgi:carbon monoxide dehydrogenase subunit G